MLADGASYSTIEEALATALRDREARRLRLQAELAALDSTDRIAFDAPRVARELRRRVDEWRGLVRRQTQIARQVLDGSSKIGSSGRRTPMRASMRIADG